MNAHKLGFNVAPFPGRGAAPVTQLAPSGYGLYDVAGNVSEWVGDRYRPDYSAQIAASGGAARNPQEPDNSVPLEPGEKKRVRRRGSFLRIGPTRSRVRNQ